MWIEVINFCFEHLKYMHPYMTVSTGFNIHGSPHWTVTSLSWVQLVVL